MARCNIIKLSALLHLTLMAITCLFVVVGGNTAASRSIRRLHLPALGFGPRCTGCPPNFCDDDPAIIHGYCCGCAAFYDVLPVKCSRFMQCPLNDYDLCESYEYMMHCCCS